MDEAIAAISEIQVRDMHGVSSETLAKMFHIPHEEADTHFKSQNNSTTKILTVSYQ